MNARVNRFWDFRFFIDLTHIQYTESQVLYPWTNFGTGFSVRFNFAPPLPKVKHRDSIELTIKDEESTDSSRDNPQKEDLPKENLTSQIEFRKNQPEINKAEMKSKDAQSVNLQKESSQSSKELSVAKPRASDSSSEIQRAEKLQTPSKGNRQTQQKDQKTRRGSNDTALSFGKKGSALGARNQKNLKSLSKEAQAWLKLYEADPGMSQV